MDFASLSATPTTRARMRGPKPLLAWVCLTQLLPLSEFLTPTGYCFSRGLAALFHAAATHRVCLLWSVPPLEASEETDHLGVAFTARVCLPPPKRRERHTEVRPRSMSASLAL